VEIKVLVQKQEVDTVPIVLKVIVERKVKERLYQKNIKVPVIQII
jgi:hypothetical protein